MLKVSWATSGDKWSHYFVICDYKSAWQLWWTLTQCTAESNQKPVNVRVTGLGDEPIDTAGGMDVFVRAAEFTREAE